MEFLHSLSPLVIDLIVVAVILIFALIRAKIGIAHTVAALAILILSIGIALVGSQIITPLVKDAAWDKVETIVEERVENQTTASESSGGILENAKDGLGGLVEKVLGVDLSQLIDKETVSEEDAKDQLVSLSPEMKEKVTALMLEKGKLLTEKVVRIVLFVLIFIISMIILKLIAKGIKKLTEKTILGWVNHLGGFLLGLIEAAVLLLLVVRVMTFFGKPFFTELAQGTTILSWFTGGDLQAALMTIKDLKLNDLVHLNLEDIKNLNLEGLKQNVTNLLH